MKSIDSMPELQKSYGDAKQGFKRAARSMQFIFAMSIRCSKRNGAELGSSTS